MTRSDWEPLLRKFLTKIDFRDHIAGILVCGSHITGQPDDHSDLDTHLVLKDEIMWRERGNVFEDGLLIEYFANPPNQIKGYFQEDLRAGSTSSMVQFITGEIVEDDGSIATLKKIAADLIAEGVAPATGSEVSLIKYGLWDAMDNLHASLERKRHDIHFLVANLIQVIFHTYCRLIGYPVQRFDQIVPVLSDASVRSKYLLPAFPDDEFRTRILTTIELIGTHDIDRVTKLAQTVLDYDGPFEIDGFAMRSATEGREEEI